MSAPTASLVRAFSQLSHPRHPIEGDESKEQAVHCKRGRSLSTPSLNTREWHQFRMLDATTPNFHPCDPTPSSRPKSALFNPSPALTCAWPSLGDRSYEQVACLRGHVEIIEPVESPAMIPEQVVAIKGQVIDHGSEHLFKSATPNARPLPVTGVTLESLLKRREAPRCFFSLAELDAISLFEDFPDDGEYQRFSHQSNRLTFTSFFRTFFVI